MLRKYLILIFFMAPIFLRAQIYLADNGLSISGTGVNKKVRLGGSLLLNTSFDLGATFTYNIKKGTANYLHILNNGNIGFGTIAPTAQLHSTGSVRFAGLLNDNAAPRVIASDINGNLSWRDVTTLGGGAGSWAVNGINVNNTNTGNVGIGVATPAFKLDVNGSTNVAGYFGANNGYFKVQDADGIYINSVNPTNTGRIKLYGNPATYQGYPGGVYSGELAFESGRIVLHHPTGNVDIGNTVLRATSAGNVLIGSTTESGYKFDVNGTARISPNGSTIGAFYVAPHGVYVNRTRLVVGGTDGANGVAGLVFSADTQSGKTYINGWDDGGSAQYDLVINNNGGRTQFGTESPSVPSAQVSINSSDKGFLKPRLNTVQRDAILSPATGLSIYNTTTNTEDFFNGTAWVSLLTNLSGSISGTGTANYLTKFEGPATLGNSIIYENGGAAAIGTTSINSIAAFQLVANNVRTKSVVLGSTWNYQTSWSMNNGIYSAEFNLGGATKSSNEGGPGSLQISMYNGSTGTYKFPITAFANGNLIVTNGSIVPADGGQSFQVAGNMRVSNLAGSGTRMVVADPNGVLSTQAITGSGTSNWNTIGNDIVNANVGFVGIGTTINPAPGDIQLKLAVNGNIYAQKLKITQQGWADYVFEPSYKLMPLSELEAYINKNKHLPDVPSATEVETKGLDLGDNQTILLKKIEELTLYVIELKKEIETLKVQEKTKEKKK